MSNSYKVVLLLMLCIGSACNSPKENPLKGLPSGVWVPTTNMSSKEIGIASVSANDSISYQVPFLITDNNATTLNYYNPISTKTEFSVNEDKEGNWRVDFYGLGKLLLQSSPNKDTLTCFFKNEQEELQAIDYVLLLETPSIDLSADTLRKQLIETTWEATLNHKILFYNTLNQYRILTLRSDMLNLTDTFRIKKETGITTFNQIKNLTFVTFPWEPIQGDFVLKSNTEDKLEFISLDNGLDKSILLLQKDISSNFYVDSVRAFQQWSEGEHKKEHFKFTRKVD